jgi:DNA-binding CsgD family transcriptional regulator/tetratricopeptide (TPR) repeat protein
VLVERDAALDAVRGAFEQVRATRRGRFLIVGGEAGVGKTSLLRHATTDLADQATVLWGSCDSLSTPRALGPLLDIAAQTSGDVAEALASDAPREAVLAAALRMLSANPQPTVAIIEDAHWADEATVDLLTFLRRRIDATQALVVMTYRDDEISANHPLRFVLGDTRVGADTRLHLGPLSLAAVATLAEGHEVDAAAVHRITGGNPFFVTELLAVGGTTPPPTVRDAVLARAATLSTRARAVLDAIAVVPNRVEMWLLDRLVDDPTDVPAVDECVGGGVLHDSGDGVMFRHELARLAVRDAVTPVRRRELHRRALAALADPPTGTVDEARVAHHAFEAGDAEAVLTHAPRAAAEAARVGAHREAAEHLQHALRYAGRLPIAGQIDLWRRLGLERVTLAQLDEALAAFENGLALCRSADQRAREGELMSRMGSALMMIGRQRESTAMVEQALEVLEPLGTTPELAYATLNRSAQHMLAREFAQAERWGQDAIAMTEGLGRRDLLCQALIQSGIGVLMSGDSSGHTRILRGIEIAREEGMDGVVALGYSQIGSGGGEIRRYDLAIPALETCVAYAMERELAGQHLYATSWLARCYLEQGRWDEAGNLCTELLRDPRLVGISRMVAITVVGRLRARRGDPGVWEALYESLTLARDTGHLQRLWPTAVVRAEAAWLAGRLESEIPLLQETYGLATSAAYPWAVGELGYWLARAGQRPPSVEPAAEPFRLALDGHLAGAAEVWRSLGCHFEAGVVLIDSEDASDVRSALDSFEDLGSRPAAKLAGNRLRELGARVPRGPNAATRRNPAGLTGREIEVVSLLVEGLRNSEIAERLVISAKTVDHHVSSVLAKLGVTTRHAAATTARRLGLVPDVGAAPVKDGESPR